ncbi:lipoprotein insertase outer membrane protein LolB [Methylobacillus gramineus]|uniref:lipoprotein insertase outer membrane protein LolB n=1 Tax=Methylobacillus gramineus TaxID=755169 RepID=UPI001CFFEAD7|nr:lipoprotein insertase outer membrane protein LolB [Methylobacillus gramineus]MCB5184988.1 lipoprotein insertase outer membrane protein LolB [Methylobacillus gramineus]
MSFIRRWLASLAVLSLAGCASLSSTPSLPPSTPEVHQQHLDSVARIQEFNLQGRIGVQTAAKGFSGSTQWRHAVNNDTITLFSPLGSQVAAITRTPDGVTLKTSGNKTYQASDAETLTEQNLGWRLPMTGLADWTLGRPSHTAIASSTWDEQGRLVKLKQDGWEIEYGQYVLAEGYQLPSRITLRNTQLTLKLIVQQWHSLNQ